MISKHHRSLFTTDAVATAGGGLIGCLQPDVRFTPLPTTPKNLSSPSAYGQPDQTTCDRSHYSCEAICGQALGDKPLSHQGCATIRHRSQTPAPAETPHPAITNAHHLLCLHSLRCCERTILLLSTAAHTPPPTLPPPNVGVPLRFAPSRGNITPRRYATHTLRNIAKRLRAFRCFSRNSPRNQYRHPADWRNQEG